MTIPQDNVSNDPYRWVIVLGGLLGLLAALGIGRFSLGMMLPAMGEGLGLSYTQMGVISTVNFCGYLAAVLLCGKLTSLFGVRQLIAMALLLIGFSMGLVGFADSYNVILVLYCLTGIGSAWANIPVMAVVASWFDGKSRGRAAGLCVMGNGTGILITGKLVPFLNENSGNWRLSWQVLAVIVIVIAVVCFLLIRERKARRDGAVIAGEGKKQVLRHGVVKASTYYHCGLIYFLYGFTYVVFVTFFVTSLVQDYHFSENDAGTVWAWVGFLSLVSGPLFGYLSDIWGRKMGLLSVFLLQMCSYLLLAIPANHLVVYISGCLFAIGVWAVPTIIAALIGDLAGPERTAAVFGFVTFPFGIGQIAGPVVAGYLAENAGHFHHSYLLIAVITGCALVLTIFLKTRPSSAV